MLKTRMHQRAATSRSRPGFGSTFQSLLALLSIWTFANAIATVNAQIYLTPSATTDGVSDLSVKLSPSYAGLGIEPSNLFAFTGTTSPNQFTMQLLNNLANYTGKPPHIRVGGNTADTALYNASYQGYVFMPNPDTTGPTDTEYYGPNLFKVINYFPKDTPVTYGLPLAYDGTQNRTTMTVAIAKAVVAAFTNVKLFSLEVGNEPDLYVQNKFRPYGWGVNDFGAEWITEVNAVYNQVLKPMDITETFFEAACTATTAANRGFRIEDLVKTGIATQNGIYLAGWNQHNYYYYVDVSNYQLSLSGLMDLSATSRQFTEWVSQSDQAQVTGKPYYLREMGSVGPSGLTGISDTFGNAIWTLNFFLYSATVGVASVQLHCLQFSYGCAWQPISGNGLDAPTVRSSYAAYAAFAQINGAGCQTQVAPISPTNIPDEYDNRIGAYAVYHAGQLQTLVAINSKTIYQSQNGAGVNTQTFSFSLPSLAGQTFYLSLMTADASDSKQGTTWNGMSYETATGRPQVVDSSQRTMTVGSDGTLQFTVRDSQVVVANLGSVIGSKNNVVDQKACSGFAESAPPDGNNGFKATSGFASHSPLSLGAIIGIAVGGGVALLALLGLIIFCCVRSARRNRARRATALTNDKAGLLNPAYHTTTANNIGNRRGAGSYKTVPIKEMTDSSDDIFMMPVRGKGMHKHSDSYGSASNSMTNSPLIPSSPSGYGTRSRRDSFEQAAIPVPAAASYNSQGSPKPTSRLRASGPGQAGGPSGGPMIGLSNLNPNSHNDGSGRPMSQQYQQGQRGPPTQHGKSDPWQQLAAQQQREQQRRSFGDHRAQQAQQQREEQRRSFNDPRAQQQAAGAAAAGLGAAAIAHGRRSEEGQSRSRRRSLPSQHSNGAADAVSRSSAAASSQGHGYRASYDLTPRERSQQMTARRPPVPQLPSSVRNSTSNGGRFDHLPPPPPQMSAQQGYGGAMPNEQREYDHNQATVAAAVAAAMGGSGGTMAAQQAYAEQKRQQQQYQQFQQQQYQQYHQHQQQQFHDASSQEASAVHAPAFMKALGASGAAMGPRPLSSHSARQSGAPPMPPKSPKRDRSSTREAN